MKQVENTPNYQYGLQRLEHVQTQLMKPHVPHQLVKKDLAQAINNLQQSLKKNEIPHKRSQLCKIIQVLHVFAKSL